MRFGLILFKPQGKVTILSVITVDTDSNEHTSFLPLVQTIISVAKYKTLGMVLES